MKVIHVNQVNENIEIQFRIMNGAQPFNVPEGVSCTIRGTKGDNFGYAAAVAVTAGSNIVTVTLTEQLTAVAGAGNIFELVFVGASDDMKVSTENFLLDVERAALGEDTVISDSDLAYAGQVLDQLQSVGAVNAQVQQNKANIAAEITRATAAEQTLQQNINAEAAARQAADNTLQSNINAEASSRATTDASLQSQINQLVAPSGEAPSAAEVENARIGSDGTVYPTLGDAIRTQNSLLKSHLEAIESQLDTGTELVHANWAVGGLWGSSGHYNSGVVNRVATVNMFTVDEEKTFTIDSGWQVGVATLDGTDTLIGSIVWKTGTLTLSTGNNYRLVIAKSPEPTSATVEEFVPHVHRISNIQMALDDLSEKSNDLENDIANVNEIIKYGYTVIGKDEFVQGSFNSAGLTTGTTTRIRPKALIPVEVGTKIQIIPNTQQYAVGLWTESMSIYRNDSTFSADESTITISTKGYAIIAIRKADNSTITPSELTAELRVYDVNKINDIDAIIDNKLAEFEQGMPDYWKTYMSSKILDVRAKDALIGADGDAFMFVTDIHISNDANGYHYNSLNSPAVIRYIAKNSGVRWLVNGGDTIELYPGSKQNALSGLQMWQKMVYGIEEYCTPGNHDSNNYNGSNADHALTYQDFYAIMDRPIERIIDTNGQTYFCMDNVSQKIRYIFCATDLYNNLTSQIAWLKSALTEKDSTWTILVIQHKLFNDNNTGYHNQAVPFINAINEVYAQISATFIGILAGHTHIDYTSYESINGYALISTTCDAWRLQASSQGLTRTPGTYTEQAFDVVHISKTAETVYLTRIGAGSDRTIPYRAS